MCQKTDLPFWEILKKIQEEKLNSCDIRVLNQRLVMELSISSTLNTVIVVQKNKTHYLINHL